MKFVQRLSITRALQGQDCQSEFWERRENSTYAERRWGFFWDDPSKARVTERGVTRCLIVRPSLRTTLLLTQFRWALVFKRQETKRKVLSIVQPLADHKKCFTERGSTSSAEYEPFPSAKGTVSEGTTAATGSESSISSRRGEEGCLVATAAIGGACLAAFMSSGVMCWYTEASGGKLLQDKMWSAKSWQQMRQPLHSWSSSRSTSVSLGGKRYPGRISTLNRRRLVN